MFGELNLCHKTMYMSFQTKDSEVIVETVTHEDQVPSLEPGTYSIPVPSSSHEISNVVVKSYFW